MYHHYQRRTTITIGGPPLPKEDHHYHRRTTITKGGPPLPKEDHHYQRRTTITKGGPPLPKEDHHYQRRTTNAKFPCWDTAWWIWKPIFHSSSPRPLLIVHSSFPQDTVMLLEHSLVSRNQPDMNQDDHISSHSVVTNVAYPAAMVMPPTGQAHLERPVLRPVFT
ncbi:hypothetical protein BgiMline_024302 [Biomphalaria glabrata]